MPGYVIVTTAPDPSSFAARVFRASWAPDARPRPALAGRSSASRRMGACCPLSWRLAGSGVGGGAVAPADVPGVRSHRSVRCFRHVGRPQVSLFHRGRRQRWRDGLRRPSSRQRSVPAGWVRRSPSPNDSTPASARRAIEGLTSELWARRTAHPDAFAVSVGLGNVAWSPRSRRSRRHTRRPESLVRWRCSPICHWPPTLVRPVVWRYAATSIGRGRPSVPSCCSSLPTAGRPMCAWSSSRTNRPAGDGSSNCRTPPLPSGLVAVIGESELLETIAASDVAPHPHLVIVTDAPDLLAARTSPFVGSLSPIGRPR